MSLPVALVVHGHFYQPPRENPWTDEMPREPSAAPFHDWNARIHAESYRANAFARIHDGGGRISAIVNNYDRLSFNFGPTLARWVGQHDPQVQRRLQAADAEQLARLDRGGAIAQAYAHPIVPLLSAVDRRTQLLWGLHDFQRRFGRPADGLWLPETAVSPETLESLIELGVTFTILAPEQIAAVRGPGDHEWTAVNREGIDTGRAYFWRHRDGSGRRIALGVFDGPISRAVAFGDAASQAQTFVQAVHASAERSKVAEQRLVLCASDGELWGHHKKFADLTLAFATHTEAARSGIEVTNLAAFLDRNPATWEARLADGPDGEGTAWSCAHGLGRWKRDCGCNMSTALGWNQEWRGPLRLALDLVRDAAAAFYEDAAGEWLLDPWGARDSYGEVLDGSLERRDALLAEFAQPALLAGGEDARTRVRVLMELQRATLLMYASCGWFFDDIAGLEAALVIRMASHALELLGQAGGQPPTTDVLAVLAQGRSNRKEEGTGADVFRRVTGDRVTPVHAMGRAALCSLVSDKEAGTPGFDVAFVGRSVAFGPDETSVSGHARVRHRRTGVVDEADVRASVRARGVFDVRVGTTVMTLDDLGDEARSTIIMESLPSLVAEAETLGQDVQVAHLIERAARDVPPDRETPDGLTRRALLTRLIVILLTPPSGPIRPEAVRIASGLLDVLELRAGEPDRRAIEEQLWLHLQKAPATPALRDLAAKLGFATEPPDPRPAP